MSNLYVEEALTMDGEWVGIATASLTPVEFTALTERMRDNGLEVEIQDDIVYINDPNMYVRGVATTGLFRMRAMVNGDGMI